MYWLMPWTSLVACSGVTARVTRKLGAWLRPRPPRPRRRWRALLPGLRAVLPMPMTWMLSSSTEVPRTSCSLKTFDSSLGVELLELVAREEREDAARGDEGADAGRVAELHRHGELARRAPGWPCRRPAVSPKARVSTYWPGGMSVRASSACSPRSPSVRAPAGTACAAVWVSVSSWRRTASFIDVPAGIGGRGDVDRRGLAAATARVSAPRGVEEHEHGADRGR